MVSRSFPRAKRIRSKQEFTEIIEHGRCFNGIMTRIFYRQGTDEFPRLGISIGRRYGNAVRRNRFKRIVRESFRTAAAKLPPYDLVIIPARSSENPCLQDCMADFTAFTETLS